MKIRRVQIDAQGNLVKIKSSKGHGAKNQIKKASILGYSVEVGGKKLNKGSLIDFLKTHEKGKHLKKEWFLGLFGGSSKAEVKAVYEEIYGIKANPAAQDGTKVGKASNEEFHNIGDELDDHIDPSIKEVIKRIREKTILEPKEKYRFIENIDNISYVLFVDKENFYIQKNFIAKGSSKDIYSVEKYDYRGNKLDKLAANIVVETKEQNVHALEIAMECEIAEDVDSSYVNKLTLLLSYDDGDSKYHVYLSPLYPGTIAQFRDNPFSQKLDIAIDIAQGIRDLHNMGYVHCDIHAGNCFAIENRCVVGDLGAVKRIAEDRGVKSSPISTADNGYGLIRAPECNESRNGVQGRENDIYCLGVLYRFFFKESEHELVNELRNYANFTRDENKQLVGMQAVQPHNRPSIELVLEKLNEIRANLNKQ